MFFEQGISSLRGNNEREANSAITITDAVIPGDPLIAGWPTDHELTH